MRDGIFFWLLFLLSALIFGVVYLHPLGSIISRNAFSKEALFVKSILVWSFWIKRWAVGVEIRPWGRWNSFMNHDGVTYCFSLSLFKKTCMKLSILLLLVLCYCALLWHKSVTLNLWYLQLFCPWRSPLNRRSFNPL